MAFSSIILVVLYVPYKRPEPSSASEKLTLLSNKNYLISVGIFCVLALVQFGYRILMALFLKLDPSMQGIGWDSERKPGAMNGLSGFIIMLFPLYFSSTLSEKLGIKKTLLALTVTMIPTIFTISWTYLINNNYATFSVLVLLNGICLTSSTVFVSFISIAISNSVSSNLAGSAMGISQAVVALMRALSTVSTAWLFSWSIDSALNFFPFDIHFCFFMLIFILIVDFILIKFTLDETVEKRKVKQNEVKLLEKLN